MRAKQRFDFGIAEDAHGAILDVFDAVNANRDEACVESLQFESIDEAKEAAELYSA